MRKPGKTAAELMAELESDPEYLARRAENDERRRKHQAAYDTAAAPVLRELTQRGVRVSALDEIPLPLAPETVSIILRWIGKTGNEHVEETLARLLGAVQQAFDGRALTSLYDVTTSELLRWAIANTIAEARPTEVSDWLRKAVVDRSAGNARQMLTLAVARLLPRHDARLLLRSLLDDLTGHTADALAEVGTVEDIPVLEEKVASSKGWVKKALQRAIKRIRKQHDGSQRG